MSEDPKEEKKDEETDKPDWKGFFKNFSNGLITGVFIGVVFIGSIGLFLSKVANANILPTDLTAEPYTNLKRTVDIDLIFMNPVKQLCCYGLGFWADPEPKTYRIQEANFVNDNAGLDFMANFKNTWLCSLGYKADPGSLPENIAKYKATKEVFYLSPFWTFEQNTLKSMLCMSFTIVSNVFYYMNFLPEWATMLFFALFFSIILTVIYISNFIYGIFSHISNILELWKNLWDINYNSGISEHFGWSWITTFLYFMLYLIVIFWSAIITPSFITLYTFYKALSANYVVRKKGQTEKNAEKMNFISFIKNVMYYKKTFIIILVMLNLMGTTNEYLGASYLPGVIIAVLILIFGMNILAVEEPLELFKILPNAVFPPLEHPVVRIDPNVTVNNCVAEALLTKPPTDGNANSTATGEKINVLKTSTSNLTGGSGGREKKVTIPKVKRYNIQLV